MKNWSHCGSATNANRATKATKAIAWNALITSTDLLVLTTFIASNASLALRGRLLLKAGALTDFSYVPVHLDLDTVVQKKGSNRQKYFQKVPGVQKRSISCLGLNPLLSFEKCSIKQTNECSFFRHNFFTFHLER